MTKVLIKLINLCNTVSLCILYGRAFQDKDIVGENTFVTREVKVVLILFYVIKVLFIEFLILMSNLSMHFQITVLLVLM